MPVILDHTNTRPQYLIWPSLDSISAHPNWLIPAMGKQEVTPYDILIDMVPWYVFPGCCAPVALSGVAKCLRPQVRQLLYQHPQEYPVGPFVGLIGVTWPYADDACHYWDIEAGYTRMTPLFESTVADLNQWTVDPKILEIVPQLEGVIPIKPV